MKKAFLYKYILLAAMLQAFTLAKAQEYRESKSFEQSYVVSEQSEIKIDNKYGRVQVMNWNRDSIAISVMVEVRTSKEDKVKAILDEVEVEFVEFKNYLEVTTRFTNEGSFWDQLKSKTASVFSEENQTRVDYTIHAPDYVDFEIKNKYGDILLDDHRGEVIVILSNGDLRSGRLDGKSEVTLEFAYATIDHLEDSKLMLDHKSELEVGTADRISIDSRSSRLRVRQVETLELISHRDKVRLEKSGFLRIESAYSYIEVEELWADIKAELRYGSLDIGEIHERVSDLDLSAENTNVTITMPEERFMAVEAVYNESAGLYFPVSLRNKVSVKEDESEKLVKTTGDIGKRSGAIIHLKIHIVDGNLNVQ